MTRLMVRAVLAVALGVAGVGVVTPAVAVGETCQGQPATIVGAPGATVQGTGGDDVIVSAGAAEVDPGAGDDLVCTTGTADTEEFAGDVIVFQGAGHDVVDRTGDLDAAASGTTYLNGDDVLVGAVGVDRAYVADPTAHAHISTGLGDDVITLADVTDPHLEIDAGAGDDELGVQAKAAGLWTIDTSTSGPSTAARTITATGAESISFDAFPDPSLVAKTHLRFTGSAAAESLTVSPSRLVRSVHLRGGDDRLVLAGDFSKHPNAHATEPLDGGAGTDTIVVRGWGQQVLLDLADNRLDYRFGSAGAPQNRIPGFEDAQVLADSVRVSGDGGPNVIAWDGCPGVARGRGGDDVLRFVGSPVIPKACRKGSPDTSMRGGAGDDTLVGSKRWADRLFGGPGVDEANGRGGRDLCEAETTTSCEVVPQFSSRPAARL